MAANSHIRELIRFLFFIFIPGSWMIHSKKNGNDNMTNGLDSRWTFDVKIYVSALHNDDTLERSIQQCAELTNTGSHIEQFHKYQQKYFIETHKTNFSHLLLYVQTNFSYRLQFFRAFSSCPSVRLRCEMWIMIYKIRYCHLESNKTFVSVFLPLNSWTTISAHNISPLFPIPSHYCS